MKYIDLFNTWFFHSFLNLCQVSSWLFLICLKFVECWVELRVNTLEGRHGFDEYGLDWHNNPCNDTRSKKKGWMNHKYLQIQRVFLVSPHIHFHELLYYSVYNFLFSLLSRAFPLPKKRKFIFLLISPLYLYVESLI